MTTYAEFLERRTHEGIGQGISHGPLSEALFPFQRDVVEWALARERCAIFADTGLGKALMQLEWARCVQEVTGERVLILAPLAVAAQETDVLNVQQARDERDERHICPLQLGVIERCVKLWSAPGDLVLSPFAGIGSEGVVALQHGRRFLGVELKEQYWRVAQRNLEGAVSQMSLLAGA